MPPSARYRWHGCRSWCATSYPGRWPFQGHFRRPRYINLVAPPRIICAITATVLLVVFLYDNFGIEWALFGEAITCADQLRRRRCGPAHPRWPERDSIALVNGLPP